MARPAPIQEGERSWLCSHLFLPMYRIKSEMLRSLLRKLVLRLEGGEVYSLSIREIYRRFHGVEVGLYTIGPCGVDPINFAPGTAIGRYSSIYYTVRTLAAEPMVGKESPEFLLRQATPRN